MSSNDLISITKRLGEQLERLEKGLSENMCRVRKMESVALVKLSHVKKEISTLQDSSEWVGKLLHTVDLLGEIESFINEVENIHSKNGKVEEVSLESLMECDERISF